MEKERQTDIRAYLKQAAELEGIIYTYEQTRAMLRDTLTYDISDEARKVGKYEYGDTIPWEHITPRQEIIRGPLMANASLGPGISEYQRLHEEYSMFHSYYEWRQGHTPPDGYPNKKTQNRDRNEKKRKSRAYLSIPIGLAVAFIARMVNIVYYDGFIDYLFKSAICAAVAFVVIGIASKFGTEAKKDPSGELYLKQKTDYENAVDERNAILAKELGTEEYCIKAEQEIMPIEAAVREKLKAHYEEGLLHPKYQNFVAVTQICEYFETERCNTLTGPDGAYNIFESELRSNVIINQLSQVIKELKEIKHAMYNLVSAIESTNHMLGVISEDIRRVESAININTAAINQLNADAIRAIRDK